MFDRKCIPGNGCWYCCHKCDVCMLNSTAGLSFSAENDQNPKAKSTVRFHDEKCMAFNDCSRDLLPSVSWEEPLQEVTFSLLDDSNVVCKHLTSFSILSYDEKNQCLVHTAMNIYRVSKGTSQVQFGRYIGLFNVNTPESKTFGEHFLSDDLLIEKPLPHVTEVIEKDLIQLVNVMIRETILKSGHDVEYICSLGSHIEPLSMLEGNSPKPEHDDDCDEFNGLDLFGT